MSSSTSSSKASGPRSLGKALLFALALCPLAEFGLHTLVEHYGTNESLLLYHFQLQRSRSAQTQAEVVFVGDSSLRSSLNPKAFRRASTYSALNFGLVSSSGFMSDYYVLEAYLQTHRPPRLIVLVHGFDVYNVGFNEALYTVHFASLSETLALYRRGEVSAHQGANALLTGLLPSYRNKPYLRNILQPLLRGDLQILERSRAQNRAFFANLNERAYLPDPPGYRGSPVPVREAFSVSSLNEWYLQRILQLAKEHGARLVFAAGPLDASHLAPLKSSAWYQGYEAYMLSLARDEAVLEADCGILGFSGEELGRTANHLSPKGAERFSEHLATCLAPLLNTEPPVGR